jgi:hypothetical protein
MAIVCRLVAKDTSASGVQAMETTLDGAQVANLHYNQNILEASLWQIRRSYSYILILVPFFAMDIMEDIGYSISSLYTPSGA